MSEYPEYNLALGSKEEVERFAETHDAEEVLEHIKNLGEADARRDERKLQQDHLEVNKQADENVIKEVSNRVQEEWVRQNPWFPIAESDIRIANANMLMGRAIAVCWGKYDRELYPQSYSCEGLEAFAELLRRCLTLAAQQLWEEHRFIGVDFSASHLHTPYSEFHGKTQVVHDYEYTEDELREMSMEQLEQLSNEQLASQNNAEEVDRAVVASTDRSFALSRVPRPEPDAPISRDRGFAADLFVPKIHLRQ